MSGKQPNVSDLQLQFEDFIRRNRLADSGQSLVLAVSGGVDSMALLHLAAHIRDSWKAKLLVAHVNHQLRGLESDEDERFVKSRAEEFQLPFVSTRFDTPGFAKQSGLTLQEAARELRYRFFEETRIRHGFDLIATAHQANDNAETVLLNVLRGTGVRGMAGIPVKRGRIIRPLLFAYRNEIEEYARTHSISFRTDSSNASMHYKRNLLRLEVMPKLESELGIDVARSLNRVSTTVHGFNTLLGERVSERFDRVVKVQGSSFVLSIAGLNAEPLFMQQEILLNVLRRGEIEPSAAKIESMLKLCHRHTGSRINLGNSYTMYRDRERLVVKRTAVEGLPSLSIQYGQDCDVGSFRFSLGVPNDQRELQEGLKSRVVVDGLRLELPLLLRAWKPGDWFVPAGFGHRKKLSDFLIDEKVPLFEKDRIPVVESNGNIVWVCGRRLDDRFKATEKTTSFVAMTFEPRLV